MYDIWFVNKWNKFLEIIVIFFFKYRNSVRGGHCDHSPRAPKNLATPLGLLFVMAQIQTSEVNALPRYVTTFCSHVAQT
jgi:hypothetical protein